MSDRHSELEKKLDDFLHKITETVFLGIQEKTKEVSGLHREIKENLHDVKTDISSIKNHLEKLNSKVATHESKFVDIAVKHATDDAQLKSFADTQNTIKKINYVIIIGVIGALLATIIK